MEYVALGGNWVDNGVGGGFETNASGFFAVRGPLNFEDPPANCRGAGGIKAESLRANSAAG